MNKDKAYWAQMREKHCLIFYNKMHNKNLMRRPKHRDPILPVKKVAEWMAEHLRGDYRCVEVELEPHQVHGGDEELTKVRYKFVMAGKANFYPMPTTLIRRAIIFENDADMMLFKLRWG